MFSVSRSQLEQVEAWKQSRELCETVYEMTESDSFDEDAQLPKQLRRAAVSVSSNLADGFAQPEQEELVHSLSLAKRSAEEFRSLLRTARENGSLSESDYRVVRSVSAEVIRLLNDRIHYLKNRHCIVR